LIDEKQRVCQLLETRNVLILLIKWWPPSAVLPLLPNSCFTWKNENSNQQLLQIDDYWWLLCIWI
jgi:hypothetical protein